MKYSVIIPAYNAEDTIRRCLDSLLNQPHENAELIIVNDGSTDTTGELCREYVSRHGCIRYFEKENGGVASARNLGLNNATGEYILFVDSDDYVTENYFAVLDTGTATNNDLIMFGRSTYDGNVLRHQPLPAASAETPEETATLVCEALRQQRMNCAWNKVYRRDVIKTYGIRFDQRLPIGEDKVFAVEYAVRSQSVEFVPDPIYVVSLENDESLSRKQRNDLCDHVLLEHDLLFEAIEQSAYKHKLRKAVSFSFYRSAYTVIRELNKFDQTEEQRRQAMNIICTRYAQKKVRSFSGCYHWLISLPIRWKWSRMIDHALKAKRCL